MGNGTALVVAATRTLGAAHTFAGQYRERPELVTRSVYGLTPNPLYLGVFQCELGALLCAARHVPALFPDGYSYWSGIVAAALAYAGRRATCGADRERMQGHRDQNNFPACAGFRPVVERRSSELAYEAGTRGARCPTTARFCLGGHPNEGPLAPASRLLIVS